MPTLREAGYGQVSPRYNGKVHPDQGVRTAGAHRRRLHAHVRVLDALRHVGEPEARPRAHQDQEVVQRRGHQTSEEALGHGASTEGLYQEVPHRYRRTVHGLSRSRPQARGEIAKEALAIVDEDEEEVKQRPAESDHVCTFQRLEKELADVSKPRPVWRVPDNQVGIKLERQQSIKEA